MCGSVYVSKWKGVDVESSNRIKVLKYKCKIVQKYKGAVVQKYNVHCLGETAIIITP